MAKPYFVTSELYFYPRPPRGERRGTASRRLPLRHISIHALREESDQTAKAMRQEIKAFLSTPSARRATRKAPVTFDRWTISIHALREESDFDTDEQSEIIYQFLSTPSARRATQQRARPH